MSLQQMQMESVELPTTLLDNALGCTFLKAHRLANCTLDPVEMVKAEGNTLQHLLKTQAHIRSFTTKSCEDVDELKKASELTLGEGVERVLGLHLLMFTEDDSVSFPDDTVVQETDNQTLVILEQDHEHENPQHDQHDNNEANVVDVYDIDPEFIPTPNGHTYWVPNILVDE
ncbi:arginine--tRNA ligase, cytoplasmic [Artemisia annua]|uniref:Arginine--tRNA ligase, cytoplasmic n=1 Tax=Artemisia annua TaxID=35608 RepID=A0A2U1PY45_ARTAN|nr:arginine--tRNA ligase, cytoplasmic [Artemisia annua]